MAPGISVHQLMGRIEAFDGEVGLPVGWFFLMIHGHWVEPDVGLAIADGLMTLRVRLPDPDAAVLLRWAERTYGFEGRHGRHRQRADPRTRSLGAPWSSIRFGPSCRWTDATG
jgi:hypothetical protein